MKTQEMLITPKMASDMLKLNTRNRNISHENVNTLVAAILGGQWKLNGDSIRFNRKGLVDGQHRLHAVIKSGNPIRTNVVTELDDDVFPTIDIGSRRSGSHTLQSMGEKNTNLMAAAIRMLRDLQKGNMPGNDKIPNAELRCMLSEHPKIRESCSRIVSLKMVKGMMRPSLAAALHYIFSRKHNEMAELFFEALNEGANLMVIDPIYLLRQRLLSGKTGISKLTAAGEAALTIKAWNFSVKGDKIKCLKWAENESFPVIA